MSRHFRDRKHSKDWLPAVRRPDLVPAGRRNWAAWRTGFNGAGSGICRPGPAKEEGLPARCSRAADRGPCRCIVPFSNPSWCCPERSSFDRSAAFSQHSALAIRISPKGSARKSSGQLAREPQFRVAGSSSSSQFGENPNVNEVARRLDVDYVVEGSVRRQGDRVRVDAGLVRASDGMRLWSDSYDGKLDDIFAIQREIGTAIAGALQRRLVRAPALSGPLVTKGEAYNLYLTARSLIRTRNRRVGPYRGRPPPRCAPDRPGLCARLGQPGRGDLIAGGPWRTMKPSSPHCGRPTATRVTRSLWRPSSPRHIRPGPHRWLW